MFASQRRVGSPCIYLSLPNDDHIVSAFHLLDEGCSQAMRWWPCAARRSAAHREVCFISIQPYHTSFALGTVQVQESGGREASSDQSDTDAPYLTPGWGQKLYNTSLMPAAPRGNGWMLAGNEYVSVRYLYKPAPAAALELIKYGCKTSCKGHC